MLVLFLVFILVFVLLRVGVVVFVMPCALVLLLKEVPAV